MGYGDELIGSGLARGAAQRGKRIAFGNGEKILWSTQAHEIFLGNPNVAPPGSEGVADLEWIAHYRGNRLYAALGGGRWCFRDFQCRAGEVFFTEDERALAARHRRSIKGAVVIEPRVKPRGACDGQNKQWPIERYQLLADNLQAAGIPCAQLLPPEAVPLLDRVKAVATTSFRDALAVLSTAALYVGPEGGLHHGAAAVGVRAVVIFGGFASPRSTGYLGHANISVGEPCGRVAACRHCEEAMRAIAVDFVLSTVRQQLRGNSF